MTAIVTFLISAALLSGALTVTRLVRHPETAPVDSEWRSRARCAGVGVSDFFSTEPAAALRDLCATCPVRAQCYETAKSGHLIGYWGGTTTTQRRAPFAYIRYLFVTTRSLIRVTATRVVPGRI
jgi:hypothetical protein